MKEGPGLYDSEIEEAEVVIFNAVPGPYELSALYGEQWERKRDKKAFGIRFKASVMRKELPEIITFSRTENNNHAIYIVHPL